jgi:acetyltransferase-like isoleucine patch superfamily enzyme
MQFQEFLVKVKRAETPFYARLKRLAQMALQFRLPIPRVFGQLFLLLSHLRRIRYETDERIAVALFRYPVLRARCARIGERLQMERVPSFQGPVKVYLGDDVRLSGKPIFAAGRIFPDPEIRIGDRTFIGHASQFSVAKSIVIGNDVLIAGGCWILDYSAHPIHPDRRIAGVQVDPDEVRPVRICDKVWIGRNAIVLPGVTIGEGAVIGAAAVVTKDVPVGGICVGNPGRVLSRTVYEPRSPKASIAEQDSGKGTASIVQKI